MSEGDLYCKQDLTGLLDVEMNSCSDSANRTDRLALVLALVMKGHAADAQAAR